MNNIQRVQTTIKLRSVQVDATSGMVFIQKPILLYKLMDGVKDGKGFLSKTATKLREYEPFSDHFPPHDVDSIQRSRAGR